MKITCSKTFENFPFAHRQHLHKGHCALIHGHNWDFKITFACDQLDKNGFVIDFGKLKWMRTWLENRFDHTLVLNEDDPQLAHLQYALEGLSSSPVERVFAKVITVPNCGAEGLAQYLFVMLNELLETETSEDADTRGVYVTSVTVYEDKKNSATVSQ